MHAAPASRGRTAFASAGENCPILDSRSSFEAVLACCRSPSVGKAVRASRSRPWDEPQTGPRLGHYRGRARTAFRSETEARLNISLPLLSRRTRHPPQIGGEIQMRPEPMRHKRSQGCKERSVQTSASQDQNQPADQQKKSTAFPCATGASLPLGR